MRHLHQPSALFRDQQLFAAVAEQPQHVDYVRHVLRFDFAQHYAPQPALSGPVELGVFEPRDGHMVLRVEVVGTNTASKAPHYYFGLDALVLSAP